MILLEYLFLNFLSSAFNPWAAHFNCADFFPLVADKSRVDPICSNFVVLCIDGNIIIIIFIIFIIIIIIIIIIIVVVVVVVVVVPVVEAISTPFFITLPSSLFCKTDILIYCV